MVGRADNGVLITTGPFTQSAKREATREGASPIDLMDGDALVERRRTLNLGIATKRVERVQIDRAGFHSI